MTLGVGGSTADQEMAGLSRQTGFIPISPDERQSRISNAQRLMVEQGIDALYLDASTSLFSVSYTHLTLPTKRIV